MKIVFMRVGWMWRYAGLTEEDNITGGGDFVRQQHYGHEIFNFLNCAGRLYGYVQPPRNSINMARLGAAPDSSYADIDVVVWVAKYPKGGCFVVGWYKNAKVYRGLQRSPDDTNRIYRGERFGYFVEARFDDATLLSLEERTFPIARGRGCFGQSNIWYATSEEGNTCKAELRRYIESREAGRHPRRMPPATRENDVMRRAKIEKAAIKKARRHFEDLGYTVVSVEEDNRGWDLEATRRTRTLKLEVKGLSQRQLTIELTPNEYACMMSHNHRAEYFLCVVTEALTAPRLSVFAFSPDSGRWETNDRKVLEIREIVAARCWVE